MKIPAPLCNHVDQNLSRTSVLVSTAYTQVIQFHTTIVLVSSEFSSLIHFFIQVQHAVSLEGQIIGEKIPYMTEYPNSEIA